MTYPPVDGVRVIGITGQARHGKDTFAKALMLAIPGAERIAFSDLIAAHERLAGRMKARDPKHLQATHFTINRARLLAAMYEFIRDRQSPVAIITGVRKHDEVELIKQMGGTLLRVRRILDGGGVYQSEDRDANHAVEADIDALPADETFVASDPKVLMLFAENWALDFIDGRA